MAYGSCLIGLDDYENDDGGIAMLILSSDMVKKQENFFFYDYDTL